MMRGLCMCGCGNPAPIAAKTRSRRGNVKGQPCRFIPGHQARGSRHWNWHGGKHTGPDGYVRVREPKHPRATANGCALEHILVAERALGKPLPPKAQVHHVNGVRDKNENGNLVVCQDYAYHALLHRRQRALDACGHANWRRCVYCKLYSPVADLYVPPSDRTAMHRSCNARYQRERRPRVRAQR